MKTSATTTTIRRLPAKYIGLLAQSIEARGDFLLAYNAALRSKLLDADERKAFQAEHEKDTEESRKLLCVAQRALIPTGAPLDCNDDAMIRLLMGAARAAASVAEANSTLECVHRKMASAYRRLLGARGASEDDKRRAMAGLRKIEARESTIDEEARQVFDAFDAIARASKQRRVRSLDTRGAVG